MYKLKLYIFIVLEYLDPNKKLKTAAARAAKIFDPLDVDKDGEITMEEFVNGYMKLHTLSNGQRRWSRKVSTFQTVGLEDLERLRVNMESCMGGQNSKNPAENESKERKDAKLPTSSSTATISKDCLLYTS